MMQAHQSSSSGAQFSFPVFPPHIQITEELNRGSYGVVFRAWDSSRQTEVAIKAMARNENYDEARIVREVLALQQLEHPNILKIYEAGRFSHGVFISMEFIKGTDLKAYLSSLWSTGRPPSWTDIRQIFVPVLRALAHCHQHGIVHRDIKPDNIMIDESGAELRPILVDFGLVKATHGELSAPLTRAGEILGTPIYMAPEQIMRDGQFGKLGPHSDIWAFAVLLFASLTRSLPFIFEDLPSYFRHVLESTPRGIRLFQPEHPIWLERLIIACLQKHSSRRPSAQQLLNLLEDEGQSDEHRRITSEIGPYISHEESTIKKLPLLPIIVIVLFGLIGISVTGVYWQKLQADKVKLQQYTAFSHQSNALLQRLQRLRQDIKSNGAKLEEIPNGQFENWKASRTKIDAQLLGRLKQTLSKIEFEFNALKTDHALSTNNQSYRSYFAELEKSKKRNRDPHCNFIGAWIALKSKPSEFTDRQFDDLLSYLNSAERRKTAAVVCQLLFNKNKFGMTTKMIDQLSPDRLAVSTAIRKTQLSALVRIDRFKTALILAQETPDSINTSDEKVREFLIRAVGEKAPSFKEFRLRYALARSAAERSENTEFLGQLAYQLRDQLTFFVTFMLRNASPDPKEDVKILEQTIEITDFVLKHSTSLKADRSSLEQAYLALKAGNTRVGGFYEQWRRFAATMIHYKTRNSSTWRMWVHTIHQESEALRNRGLPIDTVTSSDPYETIMAQKFENTDLINISHPLIRLLVLQNRFREIEQFPVSPATEDYARSPELCRQFVLQYAIVAPRTLRHLRSEVARRQFLNKVVKMLVTCFDHLQVGDNAIGLIVHFRKLSEIAGNATQWRSALVKAFDTINLDFGQIPNLDRLITILLEAAGQKTVRFEFFPGVSLSPVAMATANIIRKKAQNRRAGRVRDRAFERVDRLTLIGFFSGQYPKTARFKQLLKSLKAMPDSEKQKILVLHNNSQNDRQAFLLRLAQLWGY